MALDVMGGDRAPGEILEGARAVATERHGRLLLVGSPDALAAASGIEGAEHRPCSEAVPMDADGAAAVRRMKDASVVRAAEAVRDASAGAMVSAGNTGAAMAAALLRMGRIPGVARPAIATPIPVPGAAHPTTLLDAGANPDCRPEWLVQFARMGVAYARLRFGVEVPRVGLLSIGEEASKGNDLVRATHERLASDAGVSGTADFVGNVEGRDLMAGTVDVVVTDGFTGNVVLKTLEGGMRALVGALLRAFDTDDDSRAAAAALAPALDPLYAELDPDATGGAVLLGVRGVCVIGHGSSSARAVVNAVRVAEELVDADVVGEMARAVAVAADAAEGQRK